MVQEGYVCLQDTSQEEDPTRKRHCFVNKLSQMLGSEPAVNANGQVLHGFTFEEEYFMSPASGMAAASLKMVAQNMFYLCSAGVNQKLKECSLGQETGCTQPSGIAQPQPLRQEMYKPPEP